MKYYDLTQSVVEVEPMQSHDVLVYEINDVVFIEVKNA